MHPKEEVLTNKLKEKMVEHEGVKPSPYLDSKGILTIGVGNNVDKLENFIALDITNTKTGELMTVAEKTALYNEIRTDISAKTFDAKNYAYAQVPPREMYAKFDTQLNQAYSEVSKKVDSFSALPVPVQQALVDMQFNMGDSKFQAGPNTSGGEWPKLFEAINNKDWAAAARESNRKDVQSSRNSWTKEQFMLGL
jgi:GH24 family phage-related lysozyme (muramidase)